MSFASVWSTSKLLRNAMENFHGLHQGHAAALVAVLVVSQIPRLCSSSEPKNQSTRFQSTKHSSMKAPNTTPPLSPRSEPSDSDEDDSGMEHSILSPDVQLGIACPTATPTERRRFLDARKGNVEGATKMLQTFLEWHDSQEAASQETQPRKAQHVGTTSESSDFHIWQEACAVAIQLSGDPAIIEDISCLPRVIRTHEDENKEVLRDFQGHRIFHIIPAKMDDKLLKTTTYALATALFIHKQLDRHGLERISVCIDARAMRGHPNIHVFRLIPFMQHTTTLLLSLFPERLHKCLLYPVPSSFLWVWNAVSRVVDPLTKDKICLLAGPNKIDTEPPFLEMSKHMSLEVAHQLEHSRLAEFR